MLVVKFPNNVFHENPCLFPGYFMYKNRDKWDVHARGYNWATLFLGEINTGTWPSRLGESQKWKQ
jgi:hypothetical protein